MYVVAITRWGNPLAQELPWLAERLAEQPYDLRLRLAGSPPVVVSRFTDAEPARALMADLGDRGHGVVACDTERVPRAESIYTPKTFELGDDSLTLSQPGAQSMAVAHADILALVHAGLSFEEESTTTTTRRKFSAGRAMLTGGLVLSKKVVNEKQNRASEFEQVIYIIQKSGSDPVLMRQYHLNYDGLPGARAHSSTESFARLVAELKSRAPGALYDNRLLTGRRKASTNLYDRDASTTTIGGSNVSETDLAAHLIAVAHLRGAL